ncbi:hypothetical protein ABZ319_04045 [Nocardia sp. NPDC005978]|uniref:hypothetical protein n=1 Tax=Nocardia sp. NPDC005978 TaxID=3156725 RepID=UPI0033A02E0C
MSEAEIHARYSDRLMVGQELASLRSGNGEYTLSWNEKGGLALVRSDGYITWSSGPAKFDGEQWATLGDDGSLKIVSRAFSSTLWSTQTRTTSAANLRVGDDGSIALYDKNGSLLSYLVPADDKKKHLFRVSLFRPNGRSDTLDEIIRLNEIALQMLVDLLGAGTPSRGREVTQIISRSFGSGTMESAINEPYVENEGKIDKLIDELVVKSSQISGAAEGIVAKVQKESHDIRELLAKLDTELRAAITKVEVIDNVWTYSLAKEIESGLITAIESTRNAVEARIGSVHDLVAEASKKLQTTPGTKAGGNAGTATADDTTDENLNSPGDWGETSPSDSDLLNQLGLGGDLDSDPDQLRDSNRAPDPELSAALKSLATSIANGAATGTGTSSPAGSDPMQNPMVMSMLAQALAGKMGGNNNTTRRPPRDESATTETEPREDRVIEAPNDTPPPQPDAAPAPAVQADTPGAPAAAPDPAAAPVGPITITQADGSTVQVAGPPVVAEALNRELNNANGSNAHAAYQGTTGENTQQHPWAELDNPADLSTGDVVRWENRTGLIVLKDGVPHTVASTKLVPLDQHFPVDDGHGDYGQFVGFYRPTGAGIGLETATTT